MKIERRFVGASLMTACALFVSSCNGHPASGPVLPESRFAQGSAPLIYVADSVGPGKPCCPINHELEFSANANGNVAPLRRIEGNKTQIFDPLYQGMDAAGYLYMVNTPLTGQSPRPNVVVFAPGASGNVAPVRTLMMPQGRIQYAFQLAFDRAGYLYEANTGNHAVDVFSPGGSGRVRPVRIISGGATRLNLGLPFGIAVDRQSNLFVGVAIGGAGIPARVVEFAPGATGNVAPVRDIRGPATMLYQPGQMAIAADGTLYVSDNTNFYGRVLVFAQGADGDASPVRAIVEPQNIFINGVALYNGELYVAETNNISRERISVYRSDANGTPNPLRRIEGSNTDLHYPATVIVR